MMGTATAALSARSIAAWPPRLKMPTLVARLAEIARGHGALVAGFEGSAGSVAAAAGIADCAIRPAVIAPCWP